MNKVKNVLFVCLGNTARSPAAEYLARYYTERYNVDLIFSSAGFINAFSCIQKESRMYLDSKGIKHSDFIPKIINRNLLEKQDLILTMEKTHSKKIKNKFKYIKNIDKKTFTLREFNGETDNLDIIDPYNTSSTTYKKVLKIIDENVKNVVEKIINLNNSA